MQDCFQMNMTREQLGALSSLALAHVGDAVYELLVRASLCASGVPRADALHQKTVSYVSPPGQASAAERIAPLLTDEETEVFRRGRNAHVRSVPKGASVGEYHAATGLEALFGWLYLAGHHDRLTALSKAILGGE